MGSGGAAPPFHPLMASGTLRHPMSLRIRNRNAFGVFLAVLLGGLLLPENASAEGKKVAIKGKIQGGESLINPVWAEAADAKNHRYTFRARSMSVGKQQRPTAYLPRELCLAVLSKEGPGAGRGTPFMVGVSGGRTSPVTLVIPDAQAVQFINHDPFAHKLFDTGKGGFGPEEMKAGGSRSWKAPNAGVYEIRDQLAPSVRTWVVVEPRVVQTAYPQINGEYVIRDLEPGTYDLQGFFMGKPVGKALSIEVKSGQGEQEIREPLVVAEPEKSREESK